MYLSDQYVLERSDTKLVLLPSKLVWWPDERALLFADSHFGKASTFRKAGMAVPTGTTAKMLTILSTHVEAHGAKTVIALGDLLHSAVHAQKDFEAEMVQWRKRHALLEFVLIKGNHDKRSSNFYKRLGIIVADSSVLLRGPFNLFHDPVDSNSSRFGLCGHLHPGISFAGTKLKCFWLKENLLILPAFGEFTGASKIELSPGEKAIAICGDSLAAIAHRTDLP